MALEPPIRDGARLNSSGARLGKGARLGDNCAGPVSGAHDSSVDESSCKTVNTVATVSTRAVTVATANQQQQDTMIFHRYSQTFLLAWNRRFFNDTCCLALELPLRYFVDPYRFSMNRIRARKVILGIKTHFREFNQRDFNFSGPTDILPRYLLV